MTVRLAVSVVAFAVASAMTARADQATSQDRAEISGRVRTGRSFEPGTEVIAESMAPGLTRRTRTARDGTYRLPNLLPGEYRLLFFTEGFTTTIFEHVSVRGSMTFDSVMDGVGISEPILWSMPEFKFGFLGGRVADPVGRPWAGASVRLTGQLVPTAFQTLYGDYLMTDINGRFSVESPLPVGMYRMRVTAAGFDVAEVPVEVTENRPTEMHVTLRLRAPRPARPTVAALAALLVETTDGAWTMEPLKPEDVALAALLADVDAHRLDHSWRVTLSDELFRDATTRGERVWRWQFGELPGAIRTVSMTASDNPNQPVLFRVTDLLVPFGPPLTRRILAVSRVN